MRHDHERASVTIEEPLQELEPGEVEIVRRLVEQKHVGVEERIVSRARAASPPERPTISASCGRYATAIPGGSRLTVPESGASSPASTRRSVDLPIPFGPTTPTAPRRHGERDAVEDDRVAEGFVYRARCEHAKVTRHGLTTS